MLFEKNSIIILKNSKNELCKVWHYRLWNFKTRDTKLDRNLRTNQHTQRKLWNFENWCSVELSKIGHHFSNKVIEKSVLSKNVNNKKCVTKLAVFNERLFLK